MLIRPLRIVTLLALVASVARCDCQAAVVGLGSTTLLINSPESGDQYGAGQTIAFKATGTNPSGLTRLALYAGAPTTVACTSPADCAVGLTCDTASVCIPAELNICNGVPGTPTLSCSATLTVGQNPALIVDGQIQLTAILIDKKNAVLQKTVTVIVRPLTIAFTQPTVSPGTAPPVANVTGESPVAVAVSSALPVASVVITYDSGKPLAQWINNPTGFDFQQNIVWEGTMGVGLHHLLATATDSAGNVATATLDVQIGTSLTIAFTAPTLTAGTTPPVADIGGLKPVAVAVTHVLPLTSVVVKSETGATLAQWPTSATGTMFSQVIDWNEMLGVGTHQITATATDNAGETATATLTVVIVAPTIVFTEPTLLPGSTPPIANVAGSSLVGVQVTSALPLKNVVITYDMGLPLTSWGPNPSGTAFQQIIDWTVTPGIGVHTLTATMTDIAGEVATATLAISVGLPTIVFTEPTVAPGLVPPTALVAAASPVTVAIAGPLPFTSVAITYDMNLPLASWPNPTGSTFSKTVDWTVTLGAGVHTLTATATDTGGNIATATLPVQVGVPTIVFTQPTVPTGGTVANVFDSSPVAVQVTSPVAVSSVSITSETGISLGSWLTPTATSFSELVPWAATLGPGPHTLTATMTDVSAQVATATLNILVQVPIIVFTQPVIPAGGSAAPVFGTSPVAVQVTSPSALASVAITSETGISLGSWPSPTGTSFSQSVSWAARLGPGPHTLTATAIDVASEVATATLAIVVEEPTIVFTQPVLPAGATAAPVFGVSPVAVQVTSPAALASVTITSETGVSLGSWLSPSATSFSQSISWAATLGVGPHTLTATATDVASGVGTATLAIVVEKPTIVFTQPVIPAGATAAPVFGVSPVAVQVTSPAALASVTITSETGVSLGSWLSPSATSFSQSISWAATLGVGPHTLTATATDVASAVGTATLAIVVEKPTIVFTQPVIPAGSSAAPVFGSSPVAVQVTSPAALASVTITSETGISLGSWASPSGTAFSQTVSWVATLGVGPHTLTATATDVASAVSTATLAIVVEVPTIVFTQPTIPAGATAAPVFGSSPVAVQVTTPAALSSVTITSETGISLGSWASPSGTAFSQTIAWSTLLGVGPHTLTAKAVNVSPATATATLKILVEVPTIVFTAPTIATGGTVADVAGSSAVAVQVTTPAALSSVTIKSETGITLGSWASPTATAFSQTVAWAATLGAGPHTLTATATDVSPQSATATLSILVQVPTIAFTLPTITAGMSPAVADVSGTSNVAVAVTSPLPLTSVTVKYGSGSTLVSFPSPAAGTLTSSIIWATTPGVGTFLLTATATCNDGETAQATETVVVALPPCTTDANCPTNERCCSTSGLCYPIVASGADCDCQHPCPTNQGCFPGVCGASPQQCRTGCFPGSWGPAPNYGLPAETCPNDPATGQPAYCAELPTGQQTAANQGGACAPGDACNAITQTGCTGLPLDRTQPVSTTNPVVAYNCVPVAPGVNGCIPAGPLVSGDINCNGDLQPGATDSVCGTSAANCAAGLDCTVVYDQDGNALTYPTCSPQCATPTETCASNGCGHGSFCDLTFTDGNVDFTTGTCLNDYYCE